MPKTTLSRLFQLLVKDHPPLPFRLIRLLLIPFSLLNWGIQLARVACFQIGIFKKRRLKARVISVGNLTMGGSGKTPAVALIAGILQEKGNRPAVLTRGYGRSRKSKSPLIVSDGFKIFTEQEIAGDEPYLLAKNLRDIPVIVGRDRRLAGQIILDQFHCDTLILDDGFQHLSLVRDFNLCLINCNATNILDDRVFPSGNLREPLSQLARADAFLLTHWEDIPRNRQMAEQIEQKYSTRVFRATHAPVSWVDANSGKEYPPCEAAGKKIVAFCGLADPLSFQNSLRYLGVNPLSLLAYPDHHPYSERDWTTIKSEGKRLSADLMVTTEKDWVKLRDHSDCALPLWMLRIKMSILEEDLFRSLL